MDPKVYFQGQGRIVFGELLWDCTPKTIKDLVIFDIQHIRTDLFDIEKNNISINDDLTTRNLIPNNLHKTFLLNNTSYGIHLHISLVNIKYNESNILSEFDAIIKINVTVEKVDTNNIVIFVPDIKNILFRTVDAQIVNIRSYMFTRCNGILFENSAKTLEYLAKHTTRNPQFLHLITGTKDYSQDKLGNMEGLTITSQTMNQKVNKSSRKSIIELLLKFFDFRFFGLTLLILLLIIIAIGLC